MNRLLSLIGAMLLGISTLFAQEQLPDVQVATMEGESLDVRTLGNGSGPTVVAFWATWCSPCKLELDAYSAVYKQWQDDFGAEVVAVSIDGARQQKRVAPMAKAKGWAFPVYADAPSALPAAMGFQTIPQVYIVDADGVIVYEHSGYTPGDEEKVAAKLAELAR